MQFAEFSATGYFVPVYAVNNGVVFVARDGVAVPVTVSVSRTDADTAYITSGLDDGDIVILSRVSAGDKIRVEKYAKLFRAAPDYNIDVCIVLGGSGVGIVPENEY